NDAKDKHGERHDEDLPPEASSASRVTSEALSERRGADRRPLSALGVADGRTKREQPSIDSRSDTRLRPRPDGFTVLAHEPFHPNRVTTRGPGGQADARLLELPAGRIRRHRVPLEE